MSHVEQLEQEAEETRSRIADTLDELKATMTPGHILDQLADRISDGAPAAFARNLKDQTVNNPLPVALVGAGLAWLMLSPRRGRRSGAPLRNAADDAADGVRGTTEAAAGSNSSKSAAWSERASGLGDGARERVNSAGERARRMGSDAADAIYDKADALSDAAHERADQVRDAAVGMSDSVQRTASAGYAAVSNTARRTADTLSESTRAAGQRTLKSGGAVLDFCREQPMIVAGLGLAVGAVVGALLPTTETEDELMGQASDSVKQQAQDVASEQYENAKRVGQRAFDAAKDEATGQSDAQNDTQDNEKPDESADQTGPSAIEAGSDHAPLAPFDESEPSTPERRNEPGTAG